MKEFVIRTTYIKFYVSLFFASEIILYACLGPFFGLKDLSYPLIWEMLLVSVIITIMQYIMYTSNIFRRFSTMSKVIIQYIIMMIIGYFMAFIFKWFEIKSIVNNIYYLIIYSSSFFICAYSIYIYNKITGEDLNEKLRIYKDLKK